MSVLHNAWAFVLLLSILVFVHELGHFVVARACGVRVLKFSIGFGNPIGFGRWRLRWVRNGTEYVIAWFPLGGFVKMLGENPDEIDDPEVVTHPGESLPEKKTWQKLAIVFAGPVANLILPVIVIAVTLAVGMPQSVAVVGRVEPGSPAAEIGLRAGDRITAIAGEPVRWWRDLEDAVRARAGQTAEVAYEQDRAMIQRDFDGPRTIVFINPKGGAAKTTGVLAAGYTFGTVRGGGIVAWDNNETRGTLGIRGTRSTHRNTTLAVLSILGYCNDFRFLRRHSRLAGRHCRRAALDPSCSTSTPSNTGGTSAF